VITRTELLMALGCGIILALPACKKEKPPPWTATPRTFSGSTYKLTLATVERCDVKTQDVMRKGTVGYVNVGFDAIIENTGGEPMQIAPTLFEVRDPQGNSYEVFVSEGCQPELDPSQTIGKNEKHRGFVTIKLPEEVRELRVVFRPRVPAGDEATFQVKR